MAGAVYDVHVSGEAAEKIETLARQTGQTVEALLADALALKEWVVESEAAGRRVFVEEAPGRMRPVVVK